MSNPYCPKDKEPLKKNKRGFYKCPRCKQVWKAGQDVILIKLENIPLSEADQKLLAGKGEKKPVMSFKDRTNIMREMRRRKKHQKLVTTEPKKPEQLTPAYSPMMTIPTDKYICNDCHEKFEGNLIIGTDTCLACGSKNIRKELESSKPEAGEKNE